MTVPAGTWTFTYDALGNRNSSTFASVVTEYLIDPVGSPNVVSEFDGVGARLANHAAGYGAIERVDGGGAQQFYASDGGGNVATLTDAVGTVLNRFIYDPFGGVLWSSVTENDARQFGGRYGGIDESNGRDRAGPAVLRSGARTLPVAGPAERRSRPDDFPIPSH